MKKTICLFMLLILCSSVSVLGMEVNTTDKNSKKMNNKWIACVYLYIQTTQSATGGTGVEWYNDDTTLDARTGYYCGNIFVYVNNNPLKMFTIGSIVQNCDFFLNLGNNCIELKGKLESPTFVKIIQYERPPQNVGEARTIPFKVITKTWLDMEKDNHKLEFDIGEPLAKASDEGWAEIWKFDILENTEEAREKIKEEIRDRVKQMLAAIRARDFDLYYKIQTNGEITSVEELVAAGTPGTARMITMTFAPGIEWPDDSYVYENLEFLFGEKTVFVYDGKAPESHYRIMHRPAYLLIGRDTKTNHTSVLCDTIFYKVNGRLESTSDF